MTIFTDSKDDVLSNKYANVERFNLPSYTTAERDALASKTAGELVWNSTTTKAQVWNGASWDDLN